MRHAPPLSKTRFISGLQCEKRLYLESHHRELLPPLDTPTRARFDEGRAVGELARRRFPGGVLITEDNLHHQEAEEATRRAIADPRIPHI